MNNTFKAVQLSFSGRWRMMNRRGCLCAIMLFVAVTLLAGCHTDPNARKQKYLESGKRFSAEGKYRESGHPIFKRREDRQELRRCSLRTGAGV